MADTNAKKIQALHLTEETFDKTLADAGEQPVLVDFFATWCGPCKMIAPVIEDLAQEYEGKAIIAKVDVDQQGALAQRFGVMSIPTLYVFKNGEVVDKQMGFVPKPHLQAMIDKHLEKTEAEK